MKASKPRAVGTYFGDAAPRSHLPTMALWYAPGRAFSRSSPIKTSSVGTAAVAPPSSGTCMPNWAWCLPVRSMARDGVQSRHAW